MRQLVALLRQLVNIDTTVSTGAETEAARCLSAALRKSGVARRIYEPFPGRGSVVAEIPGAEPGAVLALAHLDTADCAAPGGFTPARARVRDGRIYGRGALDCKGLAAVWASVLQALVRAGGQPRKTVLFAATAGEETGGEAGVGWLLEHTSAFDRVELVVSEGGGYPVPFGDGWLYTLQVDERAPAGSTGHPPDWDIDPAALPDTPRGAMARAYLQKPPRTGRRLWLPGAALGAGHGQAAADFRLAVFETCLRGQNPHYGLLPYVTPGCSDNRHFRSLGIETWGFFPLHPGNAVSGIHGKDEYISLASLALARGCLLEIIRNVAGWY